MVKEKIKIPQIMKKFSCISCGKELINLSLAGDEENTFWCDECNIDISITVNTKNETT